MKIPEALRSELDNCGYPWDIENGKKHQKVRVAGRLAAILPHGKQSNRTLVPLKNTIAQVRRIVRELEEQEK